MNANLQLLLGSILLILVGVGVYFTVVFVQNQSTTTASATTSTASTGTTTSTASTSDTTEDFTTTTTGIPRLTFVQQNVTLITGLIILGALLLVAIIVIILRRMGLGLSPYERDRREMKKRVKNVDPKEMSKLAQITLPGIDGNPKISLAITESQAALLKKRINQWGFKRVRDMIDNEGNKPKRFRRGGPRFSRLNAYNLFMGKDQAHAGLVYLYRVAHNDATAAGNNYHKYKEYTVPATHYQTEVR